MPKEMGDFEQINTSEVDVKLDRNIASMTKEELSKFFHLPIAIACIPLNTEVDYLTRRCRELGIKRWPYSARKEKNRKKVRKEDDKMFVEFQLVKDDKLGETKQEGKKIDSFLSTIEPPVSGPIRPTPVHSKQGNVITESIPKEDDVKPSLPSFSDLMGQISQREQKNNQSHNFK